MYSAKWLEVMPEQLLSPYARRCQMLADDVGYCRMRSRCRGMPRHAGLAFGLGLGLGENFNVSDPGIVLGDGVCDLEKVQMRVGVRARIEGMTRVRVRGRVRVRVRVWVWVWVWVRMRVRMRVRVGVRMRVRTIVLSVRVRVRVRIRISVGVRVRVDVNVRTSVRIRFTNRVSKG